MTIQAQEQKLDTGPAESGNMLIEEIIRENSSITAYHGTDAEIDQFYPLTHFGSLSAALGRMKDKKMGTGRIYQVTLDIKNPATIKDLKSVSHGPIATTHALTGKKNVFSHEEMLDIVTHPDLDIMDFAANKQATMKKLIAALQAKGFDSIKYINKVEDPGHTSYIILDPAQVNVVKVLGSNNT